MKTLIAQIAPQRNTQYATLARELAPHELRLSPPGRQISTVDQLELGGQAYLKFELPAEPAEDQVRELGMLAMSNAFFRYYDSLGDQAGPFLRPIELNFRPHFPPELAMTRRYKGKTNEMFTHFLCNIARFSSQFSQCAWETLRVFDPLAGGGTTLLTALVLGADVAGVEKKAKDVQSTAAFLKQFMRQQGIPYQVKEERLQKVGRRWRFSLGAERPKTCLLARGETADSVELTAGFKKPHLIVADLPYGVQHQGALAALLGEALPVWAAMLTPGGAMALAWDATRFPRAEMISLIESSSPLAVLDQPPYTLLAHRVDRVIKQRDVIVAQQR